MYDDTQISRHIEWKKIIIFISIMLLLLTIAICIVNYNNNGKKNGKSFAFFEESIKLLETAGSTYFQNNPKPEEIGKSMTISVDKLIKDNYLNNFPAECNNNGSYVKLTKYSRSNYNLNTKLICESKIQYINKDLTFGLTIKNTIENAKVSDNEEISSNDSDTNIIAVSEKIKYYKHIKYSEWQIGTTTNNNSETKEVIENYYYYCQKETSMELRNKNCLLLLENENNYKDYYKYFAYYIVLPYFRAYDVKWSIAKYINGYINTGKYIYK